jgi:hypothetical protein
MKNLLSFRLYSIQESKSIKDVLIPANPTSPVYHFSTYKNRESILRQGLIPKIGVYTKNYVSKKNLGFELAPMVFANQEKKNLVYGNDCWEIDLNKVDVQWYHDPIHHDQSYPKLRYYVSLDPIPPSALKLVRSNEKADDEREAFLKSQQMKKELLSK